MDVDKITETIGPLFAICAGDGARALDATGLAAPANVLDVGTGNGNFAIYLAARGFQVLTGEPSTDTSAYAGKDWAHRAEQAGVSDHIRFQAFDASRMPFDDATFDAVFFFGVLHHIDADQRSKVCGEALRVAKPGGAVTFFEPSQVMLEKIRVDDPDHPPAANPTDYMAGLGAHEQRVQGGFMDIFIYRRAD